MRADLLSQVNAHSFIPANETKGQSNENDNPAHTGRMSVSAIILDTKRELHTTPTITITRNRQELSRCDRVALKTQW